MNISSNQPRLARLHRECEVSALPTLVLLAACCAGLLVMGLSVLT
jgi:hypothetical protein